MSALCTIHETVCKELSYETAQFLLKAVNRQNGSVHEVVRFMVYFSIFLLFVSNMDAHPFLKCDPWNLYAFLWTH